MTLNETSEFRYRDDKRSLLYLKLIDKSMTGSNDKWEFYTDNRGEWRWRRTATNGRIVGAATEGYSSRSACFDNAQRNGYTGE